jgi:tRNA(fMet)-specific endonuclease VapC
VLAEPVKATPDAGVMRRFVAHEGELATCAIVWHELVYGVVCLPRSRKRRVLEAYLEEAVRAALPILPYDEAAADWHGRERARLARRGNAPAFADGQIAAIAAVNDLVLVTTNLRDFQRFQGLRLDDWRRG